MRQSLKSITVFGFLSMLLFSCRCSKDSADHDGSTDTSTGSDSETETGIDSSTSSESETGTDSQPSDPHVEWLTIPTGSFTFGSADGTPCLKPAMEKTVPVTLTHPFLMSKFEITQKQWTDLDFQIPPIDPVCEDCPIQFIDWFEALAWCNALSRFEGLEECYDLSNCTGIIGSSCWPPADSDCNEETGAAYVCSGKTRKYDSMYDCTGYRLPTGPEWEYAAKAGTATNTYAGDITTGSSSCIEEPLLNDIAWYCFNTGYMNGSDPWTPDLLNDLHEVGLKQPNPFGLYDMLGNAFEWVDYVGTGFSLEDNEGKIGPLVDPMGTTEDDDDRRDLRGGGYSSWPCLSRAASQADDLSESRSRGYGFRPVRTLPATASDGGVK
jgi:formylglycine-generating enzyme